MTIGQTNTSIDNSIISSMSMDTNLSASTYQTGSSNYLGATGENQSQKFWQSNNNNGYLNTPNFMLSPINNISNTSGSKGLGSLSGNGFIDSGLVQNAQRSNVDQTSTQPNSKFSLGGSNKNSAMNVNAPSYVPSYAQRSYPTPNTSNKTAGSGSVSGNNLQQFDKSPLSNPAATNNVNYYYGDYTYGNNVSNSGISTNSELYDRTNLVNFSFQKNLSQGSQNLQQTSEKDEPFNEFHRLKMDVLVKGQIIRNLEEQINHFNSSKPANSHNSDKSTDTKGLKLPRNYFQLFKDLTKTLQEKSDELEATKERLEAILVSLTINNATASGFTASGKYDEQELTHKITNKLLTLQSENTTLLKMNSYGNKSSLIIELGLLKNENKILREKVAKFESNSS